MWPWVIGLAEVFQDPRVSWQHPESEVAAAIMVLHCVSPHMAVSLFNHKDWVTQPCAMEGISVKQCPCHTQVLPGSHWSTGMYLAQKWST